jgi:hypothetical protein
MKIGTNCMIRAEMSCGILYTSQKSSVLFCQHTPASYEPLTL